jgi:two-component system sensor histidine kinase RegB
MWIAAVATAELVAHYVVRASAVLAARKREVEEARARADRSEHFASLMTLAAGAAHELSTPLATIAVASRELERAARLPEHSHRGCYTVGGIRDPIPRSPSRM